SLGELTTPEGYNLLGYAVDEAGNVAAALSNISLSSISTPNATTKLQYSLNMDASQPVAAGTLNATSLANAAASSQYNVTEQVYDSLGNSATVVTFFRKTGANAWSYHVLTNGSNLANYTGTAGGSVVLQEGTMTFNTAGALTATTTGRVSSNLNLTGSLAAGDLITPALVAP